MFRIISGTEHSSKTDRLAEYVGQSVDFKRRTYIFIPDQFSLIYDKRMYSKLGAKRFNKANVLGFNRLAELLMGEFGSNDGGFCDNNTKAIVMFRAIKEFAKRGDIRYYTKSLNKGSFISSVSEIFSQLRESAVTARELEAGGEIVGGTVADKTADIAHLYELYCAELEKRKLKDLSSAIEEAQRLIDKHNYFKDCDVYFDSFSSFSVEQLSLIRTISSQAENVTVSLCIGGGKNLSANLTPFSITVKTKTQLEDIARSTGMKCVSEVADGNDCTSKAIGCISDNLFCSTKNVSEYSDGVKVVSANDFYEEADYVCAEIARLVRDEGYKYKDIAVISRQLEEREHILRSTMERYEIASFFDLRHSVLQSSPVSYVLSVFDCVISREYNSEKLLRYIKSPISYFEYWEAATIEEYVLRWGVEGQMWRECFVACDNRGNNENSDYLETINKIRQRIIEPFERLKKETENATAAEISVALNRFLDSVNMSEKTYSIIKSSSEATDEGILETAREFKQLWGMFLSAITSIHETLGDEKITLAEYYELLKVMFSQMTISNPPQKLDAVMVAGAEHSRLTDIKVVFVIGVNDGCFPKTVREGGLFSDMEKDKLEKAGIVISKRVMSQVQNERFICYNALTAATQKLYVCYPLTDNGGSELRPSRLVTELLNMFGESIFVNSAKLPLSFYCATHKSAFHKLSQLDKHTGQAKSLQLALKESKEYSDKLDYIEKISRRSEHKLSASVAKELFYHGELNVSATKTDTYFRCPFSYFCKFGLRIEQIKPADLSKLNSGSLVHYCLEKLMSIGVGEEKTYNPDFINIDDEELVKAVSEYSDTYVEQALGGDFGKNALFTARLSRIKKHIVMVAKNIQSELRTSKFVPVAFEFDLTRQDGTTMMQLELCDGEKVSIRGDIDRVDVYTDENGQSFVRIIDYKTGSKAFDYSEVFNGINLQMLIYLLAVTTCDNRLNRDTELTPAGIIYMQAGEVKLEISRQDINKNRDKLAEFIAKKINASFKRNGVLVDNYPVVTAMDSKNIGNMMPVKLKANGEYSAEAEKSLLKLDAFVNLEKFTLKKIVEMGEALKSGRIEAMPVNSKGVCRCDFCDYWSVCGKFRRPDAKMADKNDKAKLFEEIGVTEGRCDDYADKVD